MYLGRYLPNRESKIKTNSVRQATKTDPTRETGPLIYSFASSEADIRIKTSLVGYGIRPKGTFVGMGTFKEILR